MLHSLRVLKYRQFRLLVLSSFFLFAARWMEVVVLGWLVLELTDSPFLVGVASAFRFIGWSLGPLGGALSDRIERRRLLLVAQSINTITALGLLTLLATGWLQVWHIFAAVLVAGTTYAFDYPARFAMIGDVVESGDMLNAVAVNRAAQNITAVVGPVLGGSLLLLVGFSGAYGLVAALYVANVVAVLSLSRTPVARSEERESVWQGLRQGLGYSLREPNIRAVLMLAALANLLGFPLSHALMPVFARDVLDVGAGGLGLLIGAIAAGALMANLGLASLRHPRRRGRLLALGFILWPVMLVGFALSSWYPLSLGLLFAGGIFQDVAMVSSATVLLTSVSGEMRGRVMGLRGLAVTTLPAGSLVAGALTERFGAPMTMMLFGVAGVVLMGGVLLTAPRLRRLR